MALTKENNHQSAGVIPAVTPTNQRQPTEKHRPGPTRSLHCAPKSEGEGGRSSASRLFLGRPSWWHFGFPLELRGPLQTLMTHVDEISPKTLKFWETKLIWAVFFVMERFEQQTNGLKHEVASSCERRLHMNGLVAHFKGTYISSFPHSFWCYKWLLGKYSHNHP